MRPEIFFQVLYNVIGKKALDPLEVVNPATLNSEEELVEPNILHLFLADMMLKGHLVLTTNFDDLIERAYKKRTGGKEPKVVISDKAFQNLYDELNSLKAGCLIKIHGSFATPDGKDYRDSIVALLQQVQIEFPESKRKLVKKLITEHDLVVMGYSGQDDYDIYSFLLEPPLERYIWWIRHKEHVNVKPEKWDPKLKPQLVDENKGEGFKPAPLRNYGTLNPNSIVLAYSHGVLIEAYTAEFVKLLGKYPYTLINTGHKAQVEQARQAILKQWASTINSAEKYYILAGIFEAAGRDFLDNAKEYYSKAYETESKLLAAQNILKRGIISYKKDSRSELENAMNKLEEALKEFEELSSIPCQAETCHQLVLVCNYSLAFFTL